MRTFGLLPLLLSLLSLFVATPSFAQDDTDLGSDSNPAEGVEEDSKSKSKSSKSAKRGAAVDNADGDSERNRRGKLGSVVVETGLAIAPFPTSGLAGGYYFNENLLAEISYVTGSVAISDVGISWSLVGARAKWFWGNSAFINLGLSQRSFNFDSKLPSTTAGVPDVAVNAEAKSLGLDFGLGNRWQWDYFTLGCDWIGYFAPISSSGSSAINIPGVETKEQDELNDLLKKLGETASFSVLRLYLGISF